MPDSGTANLDATLGFSGTISPAWGWPSPIETDAASREFWGYTNAGIYGFDGNSFISRASDASMQPSPKDCSIGEWLRVMDQLPLAGTFATCQKQGTIGVCITTLFSLSPQVGVFCFDSSANLYVVVDPALTIDDHLGESHYVVGVRSGDALAIYTDGILRNFTTVTTGLPTLFSGSPFRIHLDTGIYTNWRHDEVEYFTRALSAAEILDSYEAALNDANARGQCDIRTTAIITARDEPDAIQYPFRHNWDKPVIERLRWRSSNFKPTSGSTELRRQRSAPRRQVEYQHLLYDEQLRRRFEARSFGGRTQQVQMEWDKVQVESLLTGATSASADFTYRDFQVGQQVLVYQTDNLYEYQTLTQVSDTLITWEDGLSRDYVGAWLKPCREGRLNLSQSAELQTDTVADASSQYDLLEVDEPLNPRRITPFTPTVSYRSKELWDIREWQGHDYSDLPTLEWTSDRTEVESGTGAVTTKTYRWGADMLQPWNMWFKGRAQIAKYLGWLYERAGQANPFWMPTFRQDLKPLAKSGNVLLVSGHEYTNLYAPADTRHDLAFVYWDGSVTGVQVLSSGVDGDNDSLELSTTVPTFTNLRYLSFLRRVILSSDELELAWETDDVLKVAFAVVDAPLDFALGSPSMSPSPSASTSRSPSPSPSGSASLSPSASQSPSGSVSPSASISPSVSPSLSQSPSASASPSSSTSPSLSPSGSQSPSTSVSPSGSSSSSPSPSPSLTPSISPSSSVSPSSSASPST